MRYGIVASVVVVLVAVVALGASLAALTTSSAKLQLAPMSSRHENALCPRALVTVFVSQERSEDDVGQTAAQEPQCLSPRVP